MKALEFRKSIPRYALLKLLGSRSSKRLCARIAPLALRDLSPPKLPAPRWLRIRPTLAGICGSDLATVCAKGSPYLAPLISMPFVMGHEVVGTVTEIGERVSRFSVGDRVVIQPALGCDVRGITPACRECQAGHNALCRNVTRGDISAGIQTGYCRDTGGGFSEGFVAHESQVYRVPPELSDTAAVLIEPFACALHGALRISAKAEQTVLVVGCGAIGLLTIAALRATGCKARILAAAKYDHQRQLAMSLGADESLPAGGDLGARYGAWARGLDAAVYEPELGKPAVIGGADVTFDCVASSQSIDDAIRFTKSGGDLVLVGMPGVPRGVDWTPLWYKEIRVHAAYAYGLEASLEPPRQTFEVAIDLMRSWGSRLSGLVGEPFSLDDYRRAFCAAMNTGNSKAPKTVFTIS